MNYVKDNKCDICWESFYKTPEGLCVGYNSLIKRTPNCKEYNFTIRNMQLSLIFEGGEVIERVYIHSNEENYDILNSIRDVSAFPRYDKTCDY